MNYAHQYVERFTNQVVTEKLVGDKAIRFLYHHLRENAPALFRLLTSERASEILSIWHFDFRSGPRPNGEKLFSQIGADWRECLQPLSYYDSMRKVFERQIRYWATRPMPVNPAVVVAPSDARLLLGSFNRATQLFIKEKYFTPGELLGQHQLWGAKFSHGDFAVFRLTPDKYHYNHTPVAGQVVDFYSLEGVHHSCNPSAQLALGSLHAKNRRTVTLIDTDVPGGTGVGLVAMVEVAALMIGDIVQCYSQQRYESPRQIEPGMLVSRGCPKSLFRPGSSTVVLLFEPQRVDFCHDLLENAQRQDVNSRFSLGFGRTLVETDIPCRSAVGKARAAHR